MNVADEVQVGNAERTLAVLALCRYSRRGASSRLRFLDMLPALATDGIEVTACPFFDDAYLRAYDAGRRDLPAVLRAYAGRLRRLVLPKRYDLLWIEKEALPWLPAGLERPLIGSAPFVLDFDDAWGLRYQDHRNPIVRGLLGDKWRRLLPRAALAICGNAHLAHWCAEMGARQSIIVPTVVDLDRYPPSLPPDNSVFTIGWIGTRSTLPHLAMAADALGRVCASGGGRLRLIGSEPLCLHDVPVDFVPWQEAEEAAALAGVDVGIMPLPDEPWERGKCAYKLIQYMAAGRPVVASPVGANCEVVVDGVTGFLAETPEQWTAALERLRADPGLRAAMGAAGRRRVEQHYSIAAQVPRLAGALRAAATRQL